MGLIGNYSLLNKQPDTLFAGTSGVNRSNWSKSGAFRSHYSNSAASRYSGVYEGYLPPYTWAMPQKAGAMSSRNALLGTGTLSGANLAGGLNAVAALDGTGTVTNAAMGLILQAIATLAGTGDFNSAPIIIGVLDAGASLLGSGVVSDADIRALAPLVAAMAGSASLSPDINATGTLSADILPYTELSPQSLANAVWAQDITAYDDAGSAGKKLNDLSGGGASLSDIEDAIWNAATADHVDSGSFGLFVQKLLSVAKFLGLK